MGALTKVGELFTEVDSFWFRPVNAPTRARSNRGLKHFEGIDWLTWRGERSWLALRSGFNGGNHNNRDLGHFIFGLGATRYLADPGYGALATTMHNAVTVRRHEQVDGATAYIRSIQQSDNGFSLSCDLSQAFPYVLEFYHRHIAIVADEHLVIVDELRGRGDIRTDARNHLQTRRPAILTEEGFLITGEDEALRIVLGSDVTEKKVEPWEHGGELFRMSWRDAFSRIYTVQPFVITTSHERITQQILPDRVNFRIGNDRLTILLKGRDHSNRQAEFKH